MIRLSANGLHWIGDQGDDPEDQCAHGQVTFIVNGHDFVPDPAKTFTVSAAALFLLRTIESDYDLERIDASSNYLIPHCGHTAWLCGQNERLEVLGCYGGVDVRVEHRENRIVRLTSGAVTTDVLQQEWMAAVVGFAEQVKTFYDRSLPKTSIEDEYDRRGWLAFWFEYHGLLGKYGARA
jgi:hypothetical protein